MTESRPPLVSLAEVAGCDLNTAQLFCQCVSKKAGHYLWEGLILQAVLSLKPDDRSIPKVAVAAKKIEAAHAKPVAETTVAVATKGIGVVHEITDQIPKTTAASTAIEVVREKVVRKPKLATAAKTVEVTRIKNDLRAQRRLASSRNRWKNNKAALAKVEASNVAAKDRSPPKAANQEKRIRRKNVAKRQKTIAKHKKTIASRNKSITKRLEEWSLRFFERTGYAFPKRPTKLFRPRQNEQQTSSDDASTSIWIKGQGQTRKTGGRRSQS